LPPRRIHVVKVPTTKRNFFPYSHYADDGHNPLMTTRNQNNQLIIECNEIFKLKPNVQAQPKNRIDIYIPHNAALEIGYDIIMMFGPGNIAEIANVNPEAYRVGPQTLPLIDETRTVRYISSDVSVGGFNVSGTNGSIYIDMERPNDGHIEMQGPEVHIGIPLSNVVFNGILNENLVQYITVPEGEIRVAGEINPIRKANGLIRIVLDQVQARNFAATLIHFGQRA
jgi:hypothetical protein